MEVLKVLLESLFIGIYCVIIFYFVNFIDINFYTKVFILGFFKHLLGYFLYIHSIYCKCNVINNYILIESLLEGILFSFLAFIILSNIYIDNKFILIFLLGFIIHIIAEIIGLHTFYCNKFCKV